MLELPEQILDFEQTFHVLAVRRRLRLPCEANSRSLRTVVLQLRDQLGEAFSQRACQLREVFEADVLLASLDLTDVGSVEATNVGEFLLRPSLLSSQVAHAQSQTYEQIFHLLRVWKVPDVEHYS